MPQHLQHNGKQVRDKGLGPNEASSAPALAQSLDCSAPSSTAFEAFPKIARLSREVIVTEKIDGTNAQVWISDDGSQIKAGSRSRWIEPWDDNFGFARFVHENRDELLKLGPGRHFGEWWGSGIQRGYGLPKGEKRFSLFNVSRWGEDRPACCHVVPVITRGVFDTDVVEMCLDLLREQGSWAAPGFMKPEGVIAFHLAGNVGFKKTLERDEEPKALSGGAPLSRQDDASEPQRYEP